MSERRFPVSKAADRRFYAAQDANECVLCAPWHRSTPGSDERILTIQNDAEFRQKLSANRTHDDGLALIRERARRQRKETT